MTLSNRLYVINLERRLDRKCKMKEVFSEQNIQDYEFVNAIDGKELCESEDIYKLFYGNDFNYRRGVIGCALSHYYLWKRLLNDPFNEYYIILEDDIIMCNDFNTKIAHVMEKILQNNIQFCSIGGHSNKPLNENIENLNIMYDDYTNYVEGILGYVITKDGVRRVLNFIETYSIYRAIDYIVYTAFDMKVHKLTESLVQSFTYQMEGNLDTDIQTDYSCLDFSEKYITAGTGN
jgi:glycosyl transferase family 25